MNRSFRYMIIDDNKLDQLTLVSKSNQISFLQHVGTCDNANEAIELIPKIKPDVVFLDVNMPEMNGIELLRLIKDEIPVAVFVTSHMEYALESYELAAFDFLLKPVTSARFETCVARIADYLEMKQKAIAYSVQFENETITIKEGHHQVKINVKEIYHLESMKDYTKIVTVNKKYLTLMPLTTFIKQLPEFQFARIHRSYAVNKKMVTRMQGNDLCIGNMVLPIGKTFKSEIAQWKI